MHGIRQANLADRKLRGEGFHAWSQRVSESLRRCGLLSPMCFAKCYVGSILTKLNLPPSSVPNTDLHSEIEVSG